MFLEVFSGSGRLSRAMSRRGYRVLAWDIRHGAEYDLRDPAKRRLIRGWILAGLILGVHLGTPCGSWSRARDIQPGPPRLRSDTHVLGLPDLSASSQSAVEFGNQMMRFSVSLLLVAKRMQVPCSMENPSTSRIWLAPAVASLIRSRAWSFVNTDFCQWGAPWRKRTSFLAARLDLSPIVKLCKRTQGCCSRSGRPHQVLEGRAPDGRFWTAIAEAYPSTLCSRLALLFDDAIVCRKASAMQSAMSQMTLQIGKNGTKTAPFLASSARPGDPPAAPGGEAKMVLKRPRF